MVSRTQQAEVFKALSHPVRLLILDLLCQHGELCVCEIFPHLNLDQSTASRHLALLKRAGLIEFRKDAQRVLYRIERPQVAALLASAAEIAQVAAPGQSE